MTETDQPCVPHARLTVWDADSCAAVHAATLDVLAHTGIEMRHDGARELCAAAGARVNGSRVTFPAGLIDEALASTPRTWTLQPRGGPTAPLRLAIGEAHYGSGPDCLFVDDPQTGERRRSRLADVTALAALGEQLPNIDFVMSMSLPEDVPNEVIDLAQFAAMIKGTRKPIVVSSPFGGAPLRVMREMAALAGAAESFACLTMSSPPLMLDQVACDKAIVCGELGVPLVLAPAPSAGSTGPASVAALVLVSNCEVLAGLVVNQLARPGAPFIYGAGVGVINMRTAVDAYLAPAVLLGDQAACDLAHWYGLPSWSYAGCSDSKLLDEQWALEAALATLLGGLSRATLLHDVGYLESGIRSSYEGLVLGNEIIEWVKRFMTGAPVDAAALAVDEIKQAGPGGNHLGRPMTRRNYRRFDHPPLFDHSGYDPWLAQGGTTLRQRVHAKTLELLAAEPLFTLDQATDARIDALAAPS
jgi:trimethylamine--corrinoid protein Co-methyltransferase